MSVGASTLATMSTEPACYCCTHGNDRGQLRANYARKIDEHGWAVVGIIDHRPPWSYTLGLSLHGHPELVIVDMDYDIALNILNRTGHLLHGHGVPIDEAADALTAELADAEAEEDFVLRLGVVPVEYSWLRSSVFNYAQEYWLTHKAPETYQIVIGDPAGKLPWEPGYAGSNQGKLWAPRPPGISRLS